MEVVQTAAEAFERYETYLHEGRLVQSAWHDTDKDGRDLACALSVLGSDVNGSGDCPATIMPRWLAQMTPWMFDNQPAEDAFAWGERFYAELKRLDGKVPFSVIYDWQANFVQPLGLEWAEKRGKDKALIEAVQKLHQRALKGDCASSAEWRETLRPAFKQVYDYADADADAYAHAHAHAYAYAYAYRSHVKRLADGLIECLARVPA